MEFFWEMLSLQETMFLLILTGVLIKKLKIIDAAGRKMLSDLLIDVILPCNIVESFLGGMRSQTLRPELPAGGWTFRSHPADVHIRQQAALPKVPSGAEERSLLRHHLFQLQLCGVAGGPPAVRGSGRDLHVHVPDPAPLHHVDGGAVPLHQRQQEGRLPQAGPPPCIIAVFAGLLLMAAPVSLPGFLDSAVASVSSCTVRSPCSSSGQSCGRPIRSMFSKPVLWYTCLRLVLYRFCCAYCSNRSTWTRR